MIVPEPVQKMFKTTADLCGIFGPEFAQGLINSARALNMLCC